MARPREFDETQALDRATDVFWSQGYRHTSLEDLLAAMGIQKGSFYNTFGSKRALYLRCLDRYRAEAMVGTGPFGAVLRAVREGPASVRSVFARQLDCLAAGDHTAGCFVAFASLEHRGASEDVLALTRPGIDAARDALRLAIEDAQREGTMPAGLDPAALATLFMTLGYGSQVLVTAGVPRDALLGSMDAMFSLVASGSATS